MAKALQHLTVSLLKDNQHSLSSPLLPLPPSISPLIQLNNANKTRMCMLLSAVLQHSVILLCHPTSMQQSLQKKE